MRRVLTNRPATSSYPSRLLFTESRVFRPSQQTFALQTTVGWSPATVQLERWVNGLGPFAIYSPTQPIFRSYLKLLIYNHKVDPNPTEITLLANVLAVPN